MAMAAGPQRGIKADINVTPLVDVVLVLLIIFMVVTPMLQRGKDVSLPQSKTTEAEKKGKEMDPLILSITPDKQGYGEQDHYDDNNVEDRIRRELDKAPGRKLMLKGDQSLSFGDVRKLMDHARKAGAKGVNLGVEQEKK